MLAARYPSGAVTFGTSVDTIPNSPIFVFTNDTLFQAGNATLGDKYRFRHFTPFPPLMPFPANYGQTYSRSASYADSTFDLSWQLLTAIQTDQPSSCVVDGYGTLKIPGHEAACLRLNIDFPQYNEKEILYISDGGFLLNIDLSNVTSDTGVVPFDGMGILIAGAPTSVPTEGQVAEGFALYQNYPNPFNPTTTIQFVVGGVVAPSGAFRSGVEGPAPATSGQWTVDSKVKLAVYDVLGREVAVLASGRYPAGRYSFTFGGASLPSSVYFYRLTAGSFSAVRKMLLVR